MHRSAMIWAAVGLQLLAPSAFGQVTDRDFREGRTSNLAALCGASEQDALRQPALGYCQGFLVGVGQYHHSLSAEGGAQRAIFCLPDPSPTFDQARTSFAAWARANSQYAGERAIDGLMRFAADTYPCSAAPAARSRR
jgi:hypothetical protein